ncbi:MAG: LytTR family DNA-binding domain-containing protein [Sediminicola sp.]
MTKTLIIDDEQHCIDRIEELLGTCSDTFQVVGRARSVETALKLVDGLRPDLVFLDVQVQDRTGFDFLRALKKIEFFVIFTTAFEKYAVQAFKVSALDYLLKPIGREEFQEALNKYVERHNSSVLQQKMEVLLHNLAPDPMPKRITIPTLEGYSFLEMADIVRCQSDVNYTHIFLRDGQKITVSKTLKSFEELLADHHFFRVHNSHLVNLQYVKNYSKGKGGQVRMQDGSTIDVSTRRKEEFLKLMKV